MWLFPEDIPGSVTFHTFVLRGHKTGHFKHKYILFNLLKSHTNPRGKVSGNFQRNIPCESCKVK